MRQNKNKETIEQIKFNLRLVRGGGGKERGKEGRACTNELENQFEHTSY